MLSETQGATILNGSPYTMSSECTTGKKIKNLLSVTRLSCCHMYKVLSLVIYGPQPSPAGTQLVSIYESTLSEIESLLGALNTKVCHIKLRYNNQISHKRN